MGGLVHYRDGYKFQLDQPFTIDCAIQGQDLGNEFVWLDYMGVLTIQRGYAWDGATGSPRGTPDEIRGSLVHDALYQLMRECGLPQMWRRHADILMHQLFCADGMPKLLADLCLTIVQVVGGQFTDPNTMRPPLVAPMPITYPNDSNLIAR